MFFHYVRTLCFIYLFFLVPFHNLMLLRGSSFFYINLGEVHNVSS